MDTLTRDELTGLARAEDGLRVTLYLPTQRFGPSSQEGNAAALRNTLRVAEQHLLDLGHRPADASALLDPARALADDRQFWLRATDGLAVLLGADGLRSYRLPRAPAEKVVVGPRYHVRPLLAMLGTPDAFWLLALSQKRVHLYRGSRAGLEEEPASGIPASLAEAMRWVDFEKASLQFHSGTSGTGGRRPAVFHGTGEADVKDELVPYFREIDRGLRDLLGTGETPLVLAGVDYLVPLYHEVNTYPHLAAEAVTGNPDAYAPGELHRRAWAVAAPVLDARLSQLLAEIEERWASERTTPDPERIVLAARHGRVESLLVSADAHWWGTLDADAERVSFSPAAAAGVEELLDGAVADTLANGGAVEAVSGERVPHGNDAIALLRY